MDHYFKSPAARQIFETLARNEGILPFDASKDDARNRMILKTIFWAMSDESKHESIEFLLNKEGLLVIYGPFLDLTEKMNLEAVKV